jgi:hypothetical protein
VIGAPSHKQAQQTRKRHNMQLCRDSVLQATALQQWQAVRAAPCSVRASRRKQCLQVRASLFEPEDFDNGRSQQPIPRASFQAQQLYSLMDTEKRPQVGSYNGEVGYLLHEDEDTAEHQ